MTVGAAQANPLTTTTTATTTSHRFHHLLDFQTEVKHIRLQSRAKEAKALEQLLRLCPTLPCREDISRRLARIEKELLEEEDLVSTDDPTDLQLIAESTAIEEFSTNFERLLPKRFKLKDVVMRPTLSASKTSSQDTRHQDAKDIERDALLIGMDSSTPFFGATIGYDGAVNAVAAEIGECCGESSQSSGIIKFARVLINAANRTTSGGDAFEAIERFLKPGHLVFVAPDSSAPLHPLRISCRRGVFRTNVGWEWGVRARTEASTRYLVYDLDDIDRVKPIARMDGRCIREFGLAMPLPGYDDNRIFRDDGRSILARSEFECDDGGVLEISGSIILGGGGPKIRIKHHQGLEELSQSLM